MGVVRTTLSLDEDVMILARQLARREGISVGKAVSELVRRGSSRPAATMPPRNPYTVYPARGEIITSEHVYRLMDEEGI